MEPSAYKISGDTIARTVILALALLNQILIVCGHPILKFEEDTVYQLVSVLWTTAASIAAWWKNNSFTCLACEADHWRIEQEKLQK